MPVNTFNFITASENTSSNNTYKKTHWRQVIDGENYAYKQVKEYFDNLCGENSVSSIAGQIIADIPIAICADAAELSAITRDFMQDPYGTINKINNHEKKELNTFLNYIKNLPRDISNLFNKDDK